MLKPSCRLCLGLSIAILPALAAAEAPSVKPVEKGLAVESSELGKFLLEYPALQEGGKDIKASQATITDAKADVTYPNGAKLDVTVKNGVVSMVFSDVPAGVKNMVLNMLIPLSLSGKAQWAMDAGEPAAFPKEHGKDMLYQGNAKVFKLLDESGKGLAIEIPYGYQQIQDNRAWNWTTFQWRTITAMPRAVEGKAYYTLHVKDPAAKSAEPAKSAPTAQTETPTQPTPLKLHLSKKGLHLVRSKMLSDLLTLPKLKGAAPHDVTVSADGKSATLKYPSDAVCKMTLSNEGDLTMTFSNLPASPGNVRMEMLLGFDHVKGSTFRTTGDRKSFPAEKQPKPHLFTENSTHFELAHADGSAFSLTLPPYSYQQLTDSRHWDWKVFQWFFHAPLTAGANGTATLKLSVRDLGGATAPRKVLVDRFGQSTESDWPDKVKSEEELKADVEKEKEYYAQFKPLALDEYGGLPDSGKRLGLKKTGFFHVQKAGGRWYLVDPAGNAFFHLGLCSFTVSTYTYVEGRREQYAWLPPTGGTFESAFNPNSYWHDSSFSFHLANQIRKYGKPYDPEQFIARMIERVRCFGFNSSGAFSGSVTQAQRDAKFPYVGSFGGKEINGLQRLWDPFDEKTRQQIVAGFEKHGEKRRNDPLLIGYMTANEPLFEDVPRVIPRLKGDVAAKRALVDLLRRKYGSIDAFNKAWEVKAESFDTLSDMSLPVRTRTASKDMDEYYELFLETYFRFCHDTVRKYDPNHMVIGCRLQPGTASSEKVCRIAGKYVDVFSLNYYTYGLDEKFLGRIQEWTDGVPMMFTEFFFDSPGDSGLGGGFKEVASQEQRGKAYRHYVEHAAALPYVVGIQWYVLVDNPVTGVWWGRYGGIRDNNGLFSVADRPWKPLVEQMAETNRRVYDLMEGKVKPFVFEDHRFTGGGEKVQRVATIGRCTEPVPVNGTSQGFPGLPPEQITDARLVEGKSADGLSATFRLCWDNENLHVLVNVIDPTPMQNAQTGVNLWRGDGVELFLGTEEFDRPGALLFSDRQVLLSAAQVDGKPQWHYRNAPQQYDLKMVVVPATDGKGYTLQAAIPFAALGFKPKEGMQLLFDIAIDNSADGKNRRCQLMWNGTAKNSGDRAHWGRARLVP